jgi:predicted nucleic acid-binding protein
MPSSTTGRVHGLRRYLGLVAAFWPRDQHHARAIQAWRSIAASRQRVLITELVFAETVTLLRRWAGHEPSRRVGNALLASTNIDLAEVGRDLLHAAWLEFVRDGDPKASLCDAASIVLCRERGIGEVFTFDGHFRDAGFVLLP